MKRMIRTVILLAALGLALGAPLRAQSSPGQVTTNLILPFDGVGFGNGELVQFTGQVHLNIQAIPSGPVVPPDPIRIHANLLDAQGVGLTSGMVWRAVGAADFAFAQPPPNTYLLSALYPLQPTDPIHPTDPILPLQFAVSVNADGSVAAASVAVAGNTFDGPP